MGGLPARSSGMVAGTFGLTAALWTGGLVPVPASAAGGVPSVARSLCASPEKPLFSCAIGVTQVAVCDIGGRAVYRYGRPRRVELSSRRLAYATRGFSGGGETQVIATNGDYVYVVYDRTTRSSFGDDGRHDPASGSGLLIRRSGRTIASRTCAAETPIKAGARALMPAGTFIPH